jgi:hypothetical protein
MNDLGMEFIIPPEFISNNVFTVDQALALLDTTFVSGCSLVNPTQVNAEYINYNTGKPVCAEALGMTGA